MLIFCILYDGKYFDSTFNATVCNVMRVRWSVIVNVIIQSFLYHIQYICDCPTLF